MILWLRALPLAGKLALLLAIVAAVGLAIAGVNRWLDGIRESGRNEVRAQWAAEKAGAARAQAEMQATLGSTLAPMFDRLAGRMDTIGSAGARINLNLPKQLAADPRYADVRCALTPPVVEQVNAARRLSADAIGDRP